MSGNKGFHGRLAGEIDAWRREGIITEEQAKTISGRYRLEAAAEDKAGPGRFVSTIALLGSILLGVGVILFFAANWRYIPRAGKLEVVIISLVAANYVGYRLTYSGGYPKVGYGLLVLGMLLFGSSIFLVAQAYHINAHFPNGFLLWGVGVLPVAYLLNSRIGVGLAVVIAGVWLGTENAFGGLLYAGNLAHFISMFLAYGLLLFALGRLHGKAEGLSRLSGVYLGFGLFLSMAVTFVFSFKGSAFFYSESGAGRQGISGDRPLYFFYWMAALCIVLSLWAYMRAGRSDRKEAAVAASLLVLAGFWLLQMNLPESRQEYAYRYGRAGAGKTALYPIANNIALMAEIVGALALGYWERRAALINGALFFFVLLVGARYFDFFWELLPRSAFFMLGGAVLIAGGLLLERKRRRVMAALGAEAA